MTTLSAKFLFPAPQGSGTTNIPGDITALRDVIDALGGLGGIYTTTARNALAGAQLFAGLTIWNSTNGRLETYKGPTLGWQPVSVADIITATGDLPVGSGPGTLTRLGIGATSQVPRVVAGTLGYADIVLWIGHTWTISGPGIPSGATNFVMPKKVRVPSGMTAKLIRVDSGIRSGTSVTFDMRKASTIAGITAGSTLTGFTSQSAVPAGTTVAPTALALADGDYIGPVPSAVAGAPDNFTVDALVAYRFAG